VNIDWGKITIYEVDPVCTGTYATGCRCLACHNNRGLEYREPRYIPQEEWTTP